MFEARKHMAVIDYDAHMDREVLKDNDGNERYNNYETMALVTCMMERANVQRNNRLTIVECNKRFLCAQQQTILIMLSNHNNAFLSPNFTCRHIYGRHWDERHFTKPQLISIWNIM